MDKNIKIYVLDFKYIQNYSKKVCIKLKQMGEDKSGFYVYPTEYSINTIINESYSYLSNNSIDNLEFKFIQYYFKHFQFNNNIELIIIAENLNVISELNKNDIDYLSLDQYINKYCNESKNMLLEYLGITDIIIEDNRLLNNYDSYIEESKIKDFINKGELFSGKLTVNRYNNTIGSIFSVVLGKEIKIIGENNINRCLPGDIVAVEILFNYDNIFPNNNNTIMQDIDDIVEVNEENNITDNQINKNTLNDSIKNIIASNKEIYGKIVGLIKRDQRNLVCELIDNTVFNSHSNKKIIKVTPVDSRYPNIIIQSYSVI